ncbi:Ger(x)C family spore germination C-terminal domain-containing protein [Bacillaceae bacterium W0354]
MTLIFFVTKEPTLDFYTNLKPKLESRPHEYLEVILERGAQIGLIPQSYLMHYFRITEADADLFIAPYGSSQHEKTPKHKSSESDFIAGNMAYEGSTNNTNFVGSAVFKEGKMIGKLTGEETRLSILLNNTIDASDVLATFPDPFNEKYRNTVRIFKKQKNKISMNLSNGAPKINVMIPMEVEVLTDHGMVNYAEDKTKRDILKESIKEHLLKSLEKLVEKTQKEFKGEPFGWSLVARKNFLTIPEYDEFNWMEKYPTMDVSISLDIKFGEFGRQSELPNLKKVRE